MGYIFGALLIILAILLILLVLVQRGRGGGLTGALGGMGGSSAFGAKAGDIFTRITIVIASIWIVVCAASVYWANNRGDRLGSANSTIPLSMPAGPSATSPTAEPAKTTSAAADQPAAAVTEPPASTPAESNKNDLAEPATTDSPAPILPQ